MRKSGSKEKEEKKDLEKKEKSKLTQKEYEEKVKKLSKEGLTSEKIGQRLRDSGIHPKEYSGKISKILGDSYLNPDMKNVQEKLERIKKHYEKNHQDKRAKREKDRVFSELRRLKKYLGIEVK
ncbi:MAG: hypothetical protein Q8Q04_00260 [archaeon]|nr:hypothetical protein [archaeon]